jgi:hypothetical protein
MNTGTPESNYGYWYPGPENDGGCGGGFEAAAYGQTWLEQPHHRGSWYYSCEEDLGYCGALRGARTLVADDPIFGRICFGGDLRENRGTLEIVPKDGVRRRFHAMLDGGRLHLESEVERFAAGQPIVLRENLDELRFRLESENPNEHMAVMKGLGLSPGRYRVSAEEVEVGFLEVREGEGWVVELPVNDGTRETAFAITRV